MHHPTHPAKRPLLSQARYGSSPHQPGAQASFSGRLVGPSGTQKASQEQERGPRPPLSAPLAASPRCADAGITFYDANGNTVVTLTG